MQLPHFNQRSVIYVALSRATKLQNLYMVGTKLRKTIPPGRNDVVVKEMKRLETEALLKPKFCHLRNIPDGCIQIVSQNICSVIKKMQVISKDPVFKSSHFIMLQETWLSGQSNVDQVQYPEKQIVVRNMLPNETARGHGTMIYSSENTNSPINIDRRASSPIDITACRYNDVVIVNMYKSSGVSEQALVQAMDSIKDMIDDCRNVVLLGDFNDKIAESNNKTRRFFRQQYQLEYLAPADVNQVTTDNNRIIDGAFGKLTDYSYQTFIYESICSDHKPIVVRLTLQEDEEHSTGLTQTLQSSRLL